MELLRLLEAMGIPLPGAWEIVLSLLFSVIGYVAFRRGRTNQSHALKWSGLALMLFPYVVSDLVWMLAVGVVLTSWVYAAWKSDDMHEANQKPGPLRTGRDNLH